MKTRILGKDLEVSAIGLGCMGMSHAYGQPSDKKEFQNVISHAIDDGYTFFGRRLTKMSSKEHTQSAP